MNVCKDDASILIIYTGGTIGMIENLKQALWRLLTSNIWRNMFPN